MQSSLSPVSFQNETLYYIALIISCKWQLFHTAFRPALYLMKIHVHLAWMFPLLTNTHFLIQFFYSNILLLQIISSCLLLASSTYSHLAYYRSFQSNYCLHSVLYLQYQHFHIGYKINTTRPA